MLTFEDVKDLAQSIKERGGRALLVGGFVRDQVMGRESKDFDLEVFSFSPAALRQELEVFSQFKGEKLSLVGESFQVFKVGLNLDVSLPRRDRKVGQGHKGFEIVGDPDMSVREAAIRRDFTMNAMLLDPLTMEILDPFQGKLAIQEKVVRMVDPTTFVEDSLRALRAVQFASRFDFDVSPATQFVISQMDLRDLPRERVWMEMEKWLMQSRKPSRGLFFMKHSGILEKLFPELDVLDSVPQDERWHPEGDVLRHTALALDVAKDNLEGLTYPEQVTIMLATLCHDLGKYETTEVHPSENGEPPKVTAHGHAEAGVSLARNMLDRFGLHSIEGYDVRAQVLALVENHLAPFEFFRNPPKDAAFRRLATRVDLKLLHKVAHADAHSRNRNAVGRVFGTEVQDWFLEKVNTLSILPKGPEKLLLGRHLLEMGVKPGKFMGEVVNAVFEMQLDGKVTTLEEAKAAAQELLSKGQEALGASS